MSCWEEDGDGVGEGEGGGHLGPEDGQGEDEEGGGQVDNVKIGQTHHQTENIKYSTVHNNMLWLPVEGIDILSSAGEDENEDKVTDDSKHSNDEEKDTLDIELKIFFPIIHKLYNSHFSLID